MKRSKLLRIDIKNLGCIGPEGLSVELNDILCLVGANNSGKSTVLRAYELALGTVNYDIKRDLCTRANVENTTVELFIHIPEGVENIAEKWKEIVDDLRIVKSKWEWDKNGNKTRQTWDPETNNYSDDGNAAGLDNVFNSRLPKPLRVGALEEPTDELENLKKILIQPIADELTKNLEDDNTDISKVRAKFIELSKEPVAIKQKQIEEITKMLSQSHSKIFPSLGIEFSIGISDINFKPMLALLSGSTMKFKEWEQEIDWVNQGTGSRRALFWSLLQIRSKIKAIADYETNLKKKRKDTEKEIKTIQQKLTSLKQDEAIERNKDKLEELEQELERIDKIDPEDDFKFENDGINLPGNMLLIDEPEVALHPNAIRAASNYLYELALDPAWQVIITTHSPQFIDPFQDHTTIVRLERSEEKPTPLTYKPNEVKFSNNDKENLKLLNRFDYSLSEMFFGQHPIIIEGDTEFTAFEYILRKEAYSFHDWPLLVRARGKYTIPLIVKMLDHFKVNYSVLHDIDYPRDKAGNTNNSWSANDIIYKAICDSRKAGLKVIHRISMFNIETQHVNIVIDEDGKVLIETGKDKPWRILKALEEKDKIYKSIKSILDELMDMKNNGEPFEKPFDEALNHVFVDFVSKMGIKDERFQIK